MRSWTDSRALCGLTSNEFVGVDNRHPLDDAPLIAAVEATLALWHAEGILIHLWSEEFDYTLSFGFQATSHPSAQNLLEAIAGLKANEFPRTSQGMWCELSPVNDTVTIICRPRLMKNTRSQPTDVAIAVIAKPDSPLSGLVSPSAQGISKVYQEDIFFSLSVVASALRRRDDVMSRFSAHHRRAYWQQALNGVAPALLQTQDNYSPIETVSVAIDLRKSTALMRESKSFPRFAAWIERVIQIIRQLCHVNGGIFDRFTGDGALAHFIQDDVIFDGAASDGLDRETPARANATWRAFKASVEIYQAVNKAIEAHFASNSRFHIDGAGVALGIAVDPACWHLDRAGSLHLVGRGIVDATRLTDGDPNKVAMSLDVFNALYRLEPALQFQSMPIANKDYPSELGAGAIRVDPASAGRWADDRAVKQALETARFL